MIFSNAPQLEVVTAPTITPFLLQEAKDFLRVTDNEDDGLIQMLIAAVGEAGEKFSNRALFTATYRLWLDRLIYREIVYLPRPPLQSVTSIQYLDTGGTLQTLDPLLYQYDLISEPGRLAPAPFKFWPWTQYDKLQGVQVNFVAGYLTRGAVPAQLRLAMLQHLKHLYDNRDSWVQGSQFQNVPLTIMQNYDSLRMPRFF